MNDQLPPSDIEAEKSALGSILIAPECLDEVRDALDSTEDFYKPAHATIFQAMVSVVEMGKPLDPVTLTGKLADMGALNQIGGVDYITQLIEYVPHASSADHYAGRVAEKALARRVIEQQEVALKALYNGTPPSKIIDSSINGMIEMRQSDQNHEAPVAEWLDEALEDDRPRIHSGMRSLDDIVGGFELGTMTIVGARPSMGKTAFGICLAVNMAGTGQPIGFVSAEMKGRRIARRLVCSHARVSTEEFEQDKHAGHVAESIGIIKDWPLWVDETSGMHVDKVCSRIRRWHREHGIQAAVIDYLQLLSHSKEDEYNGVTYISKRLKSLAQELDIALFVLAQLNRQNTQRQDKKPTMADLRGSGAVEQDADVILLLHREGYYDPIEGNQDEAQILVEKSRDGRTGTATTGWVGKCGVFTSGLPEAIGI